MGKENIGNQAFSSLTGGIEKAIIEIIDLRKKKTDGGKPPIGLPPMGGNKKKASTGLFKKSSKISAAATKALQLTENKPGIVEGTLEDVIEDMQDEVVKTTAPSVKSKKYVVKFNPSQISFQGISGGRVEKKDYQQKDEKVNFSYGAMETRIQMNFQLIFDDYERTQAFMLEKFTDVEAGIRTAVTSSKNRTYSVRPQVEGFIGAIRNSETQKAIFYWGKMQYKGQITHVSAEYTMFSTDGNPIRAVVNIGMLLVDNTIDFSYMGQWQDAYEEVFGSSDKSDLGSKLQNVGNLLNINL